MELPFRQTLAGFYRDLLDTLTDFEFLEAKCFVGEEPDLEGDYRRALEHWPMDDEGKTILNAFLTSLTQESHNIQTSSELLLPHLYNRLTWVDAPDGPIHQRAERAFLRARSNWLRALQNPQNISPLKESQIDYWGGIFPCGVVFAEAVPGGIVVSGGQDQAVEVWDIHTGTRKYLLEGYMKHPKALKLIDHETAASGALDSTIKIWNIDSGQLIRVLEGHTKIVNAIVVSKNGKLVSASSDKTIKIWNVDTGELLHTLEGHNKE